MKNSVNDASAEAVALKMLAFLAGDEDRFGRFLALSGVAPEQLRAAAHDAQFLAGVCDYLLADQSLLLQFAEHEGMPPETVIACRRRLPGAPGDL